MHGGSFRGKTAHVMIARVIQASFEFNNSGTRLAKASAGLRSQPAYEKQDQEHSRCHPIPPRVSPSLHCVRCGFQCPLEGEALRNFRSKGKSSVAPAQLRLIITPHNRGAGALGRWVEKVVVTAAVVCNSGGLGNWRRGASESRRQGRSVVGKYASCHIGPFKPLRRLLAPVLAQLVPV